MNMMRRSLQLDEVVDVDNTGKIIGIPEINVDGSKGPNDYLEGVNGSLGEVAPWMESPPSPLTPPPTKRGFGLSVAGLGSKVSFSSLRQERDPHYMHSQHGSESTLAFPHPLSTTTSLMSEQQQSLRKAKSSLPLHNGKSSTLNLPGTSSPPSSAGVAKSMLMPFSTLMRKKSKSRLRAKTLEGEAHDRDHPSLRPKTPPLPEFPAFASSVTVNMITPNGQINGNSRKKTGGSHPRLWKDKDRDKSYGDISAPIPPPKDGQDEDVVMKLDTNLDQMEGIVDTSVLNSGSPGMGALTSKGSSIHTLNQSISDDRHSQHSHPHSTNNQYNPLGPISHSEFNNPFSSFSSQSTGSISPPLFTPHSSVSPYSPPSSASPPPRSSSLAHLNTVDRKISPRTILPTQQQHNKFREGLQPGLNVMIPPTSTNGLHGGLDNNGGANGRSASNVPAISSNQSSSSSQLHDNDAPPPGSPSWVPPQSWDVQFLDEGEHEAEEEYYSSSEDSLLHNLAPGSIGSRSIGPGGRGTVGGGRPLEFAKSGRGDLDEDDDEVDMLVVRNGAGGLNGVDEHGRRIERQQPGSVASLRSFSTNTSHYGSISTSAYGSQYPPSIAGSITSVTSYANLNGGRKESSYSHKKARKLIPHPRKNSKGDTTSETHHIYGDTDTTRLGSKRELNLSLSSLNSSINQRRPSHPPYSSSSRQQLLPPHLKSQDSHLIQGSSSQDGTSETPSRFRIRIHRANNTYHVVSCGFNITVAQLTPKLNAKLLLGEERETHRLYLKERGRERILTQTERPADIVRRRLEQAGYDVSDGFELLGGEGLSFLLKFVYKSQVFGPAEQNLTIDDYERVDLSGRSLRTIPVALHQHADQITSLSLSRNPMLDLPLDFIQASSQSLTELRLSHMALKKVPNNIRFAVSLTRLDLSSNRIGDLDDAYLEGIPGLKVLKVQNNRMEKLPWHFPRLRSLTTLNISNNKFRVLPAVVCQLESLRDLDISFNTILDLPDEIGQLRNLEHLIMVGNQITSIPANASSLVSLRRLDCRRNLIGDLTVIAMLPKLEKLSTDHNRLNGVDLCLGPNLSAIDAGYNEITEIRVIPGPVGHRGPYTALFSLDVSHAKLSSISAVALSSVPSLRTLKLSHNNIKVLPSTLGDLDQLQVLECADNLLERLPQGIGRLRSLEVLDIHENNLTELPGELWACKKLVKLNATSNLIEKWAAPSTPPPPTSQIGDSSRFSMDELHMHPFPDRKGSSSSFNDPFSSSRLPYLAHALEKLYLGENQLTAESLGFLSLFQNLKVLNLSFNLIQELPAGFFKNFLTDVPSAITSQSSQQQPQPSQKSHLEELYLSGNKLTTLPTEDLARMTQLTTLFINGNRLQTLPQELGKVQNLSILDVGSNSLKYNIYNWEFDWNWNFNKNLRYLNLSGNKRLQIRSNNTKLGPGGSRHSKVPDAFAKHRTPDGALVSNAPPSLKATSTDIQQQSLGGFTNLTQLRVLGLMDVTITTTGQSVIPDELVDRRVRTSESTVCGMAYGIADTLGRNSHLSMLDLVHEFPSSSAQRKNEAIFAIFGRSQPPKAMPPGISGNKIAKFLRDNFVEVFNAQLAGLRREKAEGVPDALRRSFLKINQNLHDLLFSNRNKNMQASLPGGSAASSPEFHDAFIARSGASGVVLYFRGHTMYVANAGNALAVVSRGGYPEPVSRKHDPYDRLEMSRIRAAEGWISPAGLVNDEIDISRSFGFFHLLPIVNARPDIFAWELSEQDEFVIVANRGLWDFVSYKTAVDIARRERGDPMLAAQKLRDFAISYGADGSTMIMVISVSDLFRRDETRSREGSIVDPQPFRAPKTLITDRGLSRLQDEVPAPTGHLALVFTDIRNSTHLWDVNRGMNTAWRLHNTLLRRKLRFCGGYEVKTEGDAFMCAFPTTMAAVWWSLAVQMELLEQDWPLEILECEDGKPIYDFERRLIAQGLSVRMGIHCGTPLCEVDPVNHRMDYFGPMVNRSARINSSAAGGQIMCSEEVIREIKAKLHGGPPTPHSDIQPPEAVDNVRRLGLHIIEVGAVKLKGLELPEHLSLIYPGHLVARHDLREVVADPDASGSRVQFSVSQIRQLGLVCLRLESLATSRIFKEMGDRKSSMQTVSAENDNDEEEDPLYLYGDPNLLLPPLDEKTSSDRDMTLVLDALSGRIENAVAKIRERSLGGSTKDSLLAAIDGQRECLDERTLQSLLNIIQGLYPPF
ncbi:hypothetical protein EV361DRAFT_192838 [Lentinula raphanica]|uniref:Adenylate cyclase n=1 Tax=Lentinula raphanica TaxID=153919 RepID=A0AA38PF08_9AGAR|nr:hypothetical protein F5878DRAFT_658525 [Lentinula raphanica]KAJ3978082.1 hypothetical protein EV361DRAFT_192838 [Lentinula raphanica]